MMKACKCGSYAINHHCHGRDGSDDDLCDVCYWRKRAEQPAQQQEPVATVIGKFLTRKDELRTCIEPELPLGTKLYTSPPQRKPLTDEQINKAAEDEDNETAFLVGFYAGARFAEAAHGITKGNK